jgi:F420H(2)-dependent quinone reductase
VTSGDQGAVAGALHPSFRRLSEPGPQRRRELDAMVVALRLAAAMHRLVYRWSSGRVGGRVRGGPVLLLTTRGRKTGKTRTSPVCYVPAGEELVLAAAAGGRPQHPAWYLNVRTNPDVGAHLGAAQRTMVARIADGLERARVWERLRQQYPVCADYEQRSRRVIPIVILRPAIPAVAGRPLSDRRDVPRRDGEQAILP